VRIAVDLSLQDTPTPTGVERAQAVLLDALLAADADHEYLLACPGRVPERWRHSARVQLAEGGGGPLWLWRETALPAAVRRFDAQLFHAPVSALPLRVRCPMLATLHELPWAGGDEGQGDRSSAHRLRLHLAAHFAARLLCVSRRTADDLLALHPQAAPRVRLTPHGVDPRFALAPASAAQAPPFVLAVGRLRRKKNLLCLLEAFALHLADRRRQGRSPEQLMLAGPPGDASEDLAHRAAQPDLVGRVLLPGFVDDEQLLTLHATARCLVQPSLFEGFGLPVLEAMATGLPVLASRQGVVEEAAGGAHDEALLAVDGRDPVALAQGLSRVLDDEPLRQQLVRRGRVQAARRSARAAADAVLAVYAEFAA